MDAVNGSDYGGAPMESTWSAYRSFTIAPAPDLGSESAWPMWSSGPLAVNEASGNLLLTVPTPSFPTAAGPLGVGISYNSHDGSSNGLGTGWTIGPDGAVKLIDLTTASPAVDEIERVLPDGGIALYKHSGTNASVYLPTDGGNSQLTKNPDGTFTLIDDDGSIYSFDAESAGVARLNGVQTYAGNAGAANLVLHYTSNLLDQVTAKDGSNTVATLYLTWHSLDSTNCPSAIVCIAGPDGVKWKYVGDGSGGTSGNLQTVNDGTRDLLKITYVSGKPEKLQNADDLATSSSHDVVISYDGSNRVGSLTQENVSGQTPNTSSTWSFGYNACPASGSRCTTDATAHAHGSLAAGTTRSATGYTTITAPCEQSGAACSGRTGGKQTTVLFDDALQRMETVEPIGSPAYYTQTQYTPDGKLQWSEDETGAATDYSYDATNGTLTTMTGPDPGSGSRPVSSYNYDEAALGRLGGAGSYSPGPPLHGLQAYYYRSTNFTSPSYGPRADAVETDVSSPTSSAQLAWGSDGPPALFTTGSGPNTGYSVRFIGDLTIGAGSDPARQYEFQTIAEGGVALTLDGQRLIDALSTTGTNTILATAGADTSYVNPNGITLAPGKHRLVLEYVENTPTGTTPSGGIDLQYKCVDPSGCGSQPTSWTNIPAAVLTPAWDDQTSSVSPMGRVGFSHYDKPSNGLPQYTAADETGTGSGYSGTVLADSPSLYWRLGESSGSTAADSSPSGANGSYINGPTLGASGTVAGDTNTAVTLNGSNQYVHLASPSLPTGSSARSVEVWLKTTSTARQGLFDYGTLAAGQQFGLFLDGPSSLLAWGWGESYDREFTTPYPITDGGWHQIVETYNGSMITIYLDGNSIGSSSDTLNTAINANGFNIGVSDPGGSDGNSNLYLNGTVDEVSVYPNALTATQVHTHYQASQGTLHLTSFGYDGLGRTTGKVLPNGNASPTFGTSFNSSYGASSSDYGDLQSPPDPSTSNYGTTYTYYGDADKETTPGSLGTGTGCPGSATNVDQLGLLETEQQHGLHAVTTIYDAAGRPVSVSKAAGTIVSCYDAEGRLVATENTTTDTNPTINTYDPNGNLLTTSHTAASGDDVAGTITNSYDEAGRLVTTTDANGAQETIVYDEDGNPVSRTTTPTPVPSGLVAAYGFDEGSGSTTADASGNGNTATLSGATWTTSGKYGDALTFNGTSSMVGVAPSSSLNLSTGMTLEAWVKPTIVDDTLRDVINKPDHIYYLEATSDNGDVPNGGGCINECWHEIFGPSPLSTGTWAHLALTYDGSTERLYVNGTLVDSNSISGSLLSSGNHLTIGGDGYYGQYFAGTIDEIRIYNRALTAGELAADMSTPVSSTGASYTASYSYNDADQLAGETDPAGHSYSFYYDSRGNLRGTQYPNSTFSWTDTDPLGETTDLYNRHGTISSTTTTAPSDSSPIADYSYTYNADGQKLTMTSKIGAGSSQTSSYAYDSLGRLQQLTPPSGSCSRYSYDLDSNRTTLATATDSAGSCGSFSTAVSYSYTTGTHTPVDALTSVTPAGSGATSYSYGGGGTTSGDGMLISRGSDSFGYDGLGRTRDTVVSGKSVCYRYDPAGGLETRDYDASGDSGCATPTSTTNYLLGDLYETDATGTITTSYTDSPAGDLASYNGAPTSSSTITYLYYDGHGNQIAQVNSSGTTTQSFDPWGAPQSSVAANSTIHAYVGRWNKQYDTTSGLILMGARPYDPTLGRFLTIDPIDGGSLNNYDYAGQDPINAYDLNGTVKRYLRDKTIKTVSRSNTLGEKITVSVVERKGDPVDKLRVSVNLQVSVATLPYMETASAAITDLSDLGNSQMALIRAGQMAGGAPKRNAHTSILINSSDHVLVHTLAAYEFPEPVGPDISQWGGIIQMNP